jgi:hypothetical protein
MNTRPIPRTKEPIPTVGLGTWQAFDVDPSARTPLVEVMRQFLAAGGRVIDSSPMYGRAEGIVGDVLADLGAIGTPFLATKVWTRGKSQGIAEMERSRQRMRAERRERSETGGGDPDGSAGGAGGNAPGAIDRTEPEEAPAEPAEIPEELTLFDHQHFVEVELVHGTKLIGTLLDSAPAEQARVGDHLNQLGRWLRLWTTDQHYLINVQQVVAVTELGEVWG